MFLENARDIVEIEACPKNFQAKFWTTLKLQMLVKGYLVIISDIFFEFCIKTYVDDQSSELTRRLK